MPGDLLPEKVTIDVDAIVDAIASAIPELPKIQVPEQAAEAIPFLEVYVGDAVTVLTKGVQTALEVVVHA